MLTGNTTTKTGWKVSESAENASKFFGPIEARACEFKNSDYYPEGWYCYLSIGSDEIRVTYTEIGADPIEYVKGRKDGYAEEKALAALDKKIKEIIKSWSK